MKWKLPPLVLFVVWAVANGQEDYSQWAHYKSIALNTVNAGVATDQIHFPVLVRLNSTDTDVFSGALAGGADLRFTKADGKTRLPHQIERWDAADKAAEIWVSVDTVKGNNSAQSILMFWGNAGAADSSKGPAVFDTANGFQAVWHFAQSPSANALDATANGLDAAPMGGVLDTAGAIGRGKSFDGTDAYYNVANSASGKLNFPDKGTYTISAWVYSNALDNQYHGIVCKSDYQYTLQQTNQNYDQLAEYSPDGWYNVVATPTAKTWQHVVGVHSGAAFSIYINGVLASSTVDIYAATDPRDTTQNVTLGSQGAARFWNGMIDEARISSVTRSADWIKLEYANERTNQTLVTLGATVTQTAPSNLSYSRNPAVYDIGVATVANSPTVTGTVTGYSVNPALPGGLTLNTATGVVTGTPDTADTAADYTVTASNALGSTTVKLNITVLAAPSALAYAVNPAAYVVGTAIAPNNPTVAGTVTHYSVHPALPAGLNLDTNTGVIAGTPNTVTPGADYTVHASNAAGADSVAVHITVTPAVTAPAGLTYRRDSLALSEGQAMAADTPSVTGSAARYSVAPALPAGLGLDSTTGILSGTPTTASTQARYVVTAANTAGSVSDTLKITVQLTAPRGLAYSPDTVVYPTGASIAPLTPTLIGSATDFTVSPELPSGLVLDAASGVIWGTPTGGAPPTDYSIIASNAVGTDTTSVRISVTGATSVAMAEAGTRIRIQIPGAASVLFLPPASATGPVRFVLTDLSGRRLWSQSLEVAPNAGEKILTLPSGSWHGLYIACMRWTDPKSPDISRSLRKMLSVP